jgi:endonuclease YncB( thermonuclease family)
MLKICLAFALTVSTAFAAEVRVIDGDTVDIDGVRVRIENIDTPETYRYRCVAELVLGMRAKQRLMDLLRDSKVSYEGTKKDRFGRTLAVVYANGVDVGETLIADGLAVRWKAGPRAKAERMAAWCPTK